MTPIKSSYIFIYAILLLIGHCLTTSTDQAWSHRMLESIVLRQQGVTYSGASTSTIANGILVLAINSAMELYPNRTSQYQSYRQQVLDTTCTSLTNGTHDATLPLDRFSIANDISDVSNTNTSIQSSIQTEALTALDESFDLQPRNYLGGLWYYAVYPEWSYLDGMFSVLPYLALRPDLNVTELDLQISLLSSHGIDMQSRLLVHGYDASRTAIWADSVSGASSYVWGRSLGWFLAGLVQTYEILCLEDTSRAEVEGVCSTLSALFTSLTSALLPYADKDTGAWFQLTTFPGRAGNWLESSSTALFIFTMLKALRLKMLPSSPDQVQTITDAAFKAFKFTVSSGQFVQDHGNGTLGWNATVAVCSLNSTATYEYYTGRPIEENSLIGESAFVLAALEVERLQSD